MEQLLNDGLIYSTDPSRSDFVVERDGRKIYRTKSGNFFQTSHVNDGLFSEHPVFISRQVGDVRLDIINSNLTTKQKIELLKKFLNFDVNYA